MISNYSVNILPQRTLINYIVLIEKDNEDTWHYLVRW